MKNNKFFLKQRPAFSAFLLTWAFLVLYHWAYGPAHFPFDAGVYWELSTPETLQDFPRIYRGYFYPLTLAPAHYLADIFGWPALNVFRVYSSGLGAFVLAVAFPSFFILAFGGQAGLIRRLLFVLLVLLMFPGPLLYPLSDLPALAMLVMAAWLILDSTQSKRSVLHTLLQLTTAGFLAYGAYNTRIIYFPSMLLLLPLVAVQRQSRVGVGTRLLAVCAVIAGMVCAAIPQSLLNHKHDGTLSPLLAIQTSEQSLFARQLIWGISIQRYGTFFNPETKEGSGVFSIDAAGTRLFDAMEISGKDATLHGYLTLVAKNPLHFLAIYTRHFFNGLDVRDGEGYIRKFGDQQTSWSILSFLLTFLAAWTLYLMYDKRRNARSLPVADTAEEPSGSTHIAIATWPAWLFLLLLPVLMITPGAVETRFFLPLHLLAYATIAFHCRPRAIVTHARLSPFPALVLVACFLIFNTITSESIRQQQQSIELKYMLMD